LFFKQLAIQQGWLAKDQNAAVKNSKKIMVVLVSFSFTCQLPMTACQFLWSKTSDGLTTL